MKRNHIKQLAIILLCIVQIFNASAVSVFANSAQTRFNGVDSTGAIMPDKESPIIVERELLTFDIDEFPFNYYQTEAEYLAYNAKVTAEYTFYNPSEYTVTSKLLFPFGNVPQYGDGYHTNIGTFEAFDDTNKFDVMINGEVAEKSIRHTLSSLHEPFELERDLALLYDEFVGDDFYKPNLPVTKYVFKVSEVDTKTYPSADVGFDVAKGISDYRIYFPQQNGSHIQKNEDMRIHTSVMENDGEFELYVMGKPFSTIPQWNIYRNGGVEDKDVIYGNVELISIETTTFQEFALSNRSEQSAVSKVDWYNALVTELKDSTKHSPDYPIVECYCFRNSFSRSLMRWYEYEITLAPKERIVNTVTAPMYPSIDLGWEPDIFNYKYLLSPAKTWKSFGKLEIVINTPYFITDGAVGDYVLKTELAALVNDETAKEGLTKTENGYRVTLEGLPNGELTFTLSTAQTPQKQTFHSFSEPNWPGIILVCVIIAGAAAIVGFNLYWIFKKRKTK